MLSDNIKKLRQGMGLSQQSLADRMHVVRQTVSKWEKGLSVPDAEMLIRLADVLETSVAKLLGEPPQGQDAVGRQLEQLNLLLAERNRRNRKIAKVVAIVLCVLVLLFVLTAAAVILLGFTGHSSYTTAVSATFEKMG